jgi:dTDP-glucose 4,6-dehydratase
MTILVTGGAGFIGSNFIIEWFKSSNEPIINIDKLTYAGNLNNLKALNDSDSPYDFIKGDIADRQLAKLILEKHSIRGIVNFAAESHVDRSIQDSETFIRTNVLGVTSLLLEFTSHWQKNLNTLENPIFLHVSTDEVFGDLDVDEDSFTESRKYFPNNPYSASKAASDHIVRAFYKTYGVPVITSNCSNNYGPFQFPEKFIPMIIKRALEGDQISIYGDGSNIRDWLYVTDHCSALRIILEDGLVGENYNIGGDSEKSNLTVANTICEILDALKPKNNGHSYKDQIFFVDDRPGHDKRYAINCEKLKSLLGWRQIESFETGIIKTVEWYLSNQDWPN